MRGSEDYNCTGSGSFSQIVMSTAWWPRFYRAVIQSNQMTGVLPRSMPINVICM